MTVIFQIDVNWHDGVTARAHRVFELVFTLRICLQPAAATLARGTAREMR
jgi:hypothetical protein